MLYIYISNFQSGVIAKKIPGYLILICCLILNASFNKPRVVIAPVSNPIAPVEISYPKNYFKPPMYGQLTLAGNFGEPRSGHFHTGLDFKTNEGEGYKVYASASGYVSRINVSASGYGNALYITHPNGYVTMYGHLKEFNSQLMTRLRKEQYAKKSFSVDISLSASEFPVKQGDVIALSGNTGSSGGPHLHFEIRDSSERPINPLLFGIPVKDNMRPLVSSLKFYALDELKYSCDGYRVKVVGIDSLYEVADGEIKLNAGKVGIAVNTYDAMNDTKNKVGIYNMKLYDNGKEKYEFKMDRFSIPDARYVISYMDYPIFNREKATYFNKCFVEPGNRGPLFSNLENRGIVDISDGKAHDIKIEASDYAGNTSIIRFKMVFDKTSILFKGKDAPYLSRFDYDKPNEFSNPDIKLKVPVGCLFDTVYFNYSSSVSAEPNIFSKVHEVGNSSTWTYGWFNISIKPENLDSKLIDKALVICKDDKGDETSCGGKSENGYITARNRRFGTYYIKIDTTAPRIVPINLTQGKNIRGVKKVHFKISDNLSGISKFDTYLDGEWVLTEFDAKTATLSHTLNPALKAGDHIFKVLVIDERNNIAQLALKFKL